MNLFSKEIKKWLFSTHTHSGRLARSRQVNHPCHPCEKTADPSHQSGCNEMKGGQISRPAMGFLQLSMEIFFWVCVFSFGCTKRPVFFFERSAPKHLDNVYINFRFKVHILFIWLCLKILVPGSNFRTTKFVAVKLGIPNIRLNSSIWNIRTQFVQALSRSVEKGVKKRQFPSQSGWTCFHHQRWWLFKIKTQKVFQVTFFKKNTTIVDFM